MLTRNTIIVSVVIIAILSTYGFNAYLDSQRTKELEGVEVSEYQGEKLGSIDDFRENSIKGPQKVDIDSYMLQITGLVQTPKNYTYTEVLDGFRQHKKVVTLNCVEGWSVNILWEGFLVSEILEETDVSPKAKTVIFHAEDGYTTSLPLDYIAENEIIMAYKMNEVVLTHEKGFPFQLVAENKWGYKWIKWITKIELSDDEGYKGYWENRGYSNDADLDRSFLER